jgi:Holliday junction resolvasome RuvABC endonuclease subunit
MIVAGLDVDSKGAHYALWDGDTSPMWGNVNDRKDLEVFTRAGVQVVYVEQIPFVQNKQTMRLLCEFVGRWKERIETTGLRCENIEVAKWKMLAIGNGRASKDDVKGLMVLTTNLPDTLEQHSYDALGVAIAGYALEHQKKMAGALL